MNELVEIQIFNFELIGWDCLCWIKIFRKL